jgi:ADP-ribosyl-[dinitrogen reductase] hydrolase
MTVFTRDQILGCVVGGAIGDAIGGIPERKSISLSDDTQLTLATCEALTQGARNAAEIAEHLLRWFREGRISGIGSSTLKAMRDLDAGAHWALAGARGEMAAGNGAAMRIAPLAFVVDPVDASDRVLIRDVSRITHHSDEAYIGALAVLLAIHLGAPSADVVDTLASIADLLPDSRSRDRLVEISPSSEAPLSTLAATFGSSGYVVDTVPLAIIAAARMTAETFETVLYELNEAGGDTDTIGSIAGQIAGVSTGLRSLPENLIQLLPPDPPVLKIAEEFARAAAAE